MIRRLILAGALALLAACAGGPPSVNGQLKTGYDTVNAYVEVTKASLARERITVDQAAKASATAKKAMGTLDAAGVALAGCKPPVACTDYLVLMQALQPSLLEMELELRRQAKEQAK